MTTTLEHPTDIIVDEPIPGTEFEALTDDDELTPQQKEWMAQPAPYGRVASGPEKGRPKSKPGRPRKAAGARKATPPPRPKKAAPSKTDPDEVDYRPGIRGLLGDAVASVAIAGMMRVNTPQGRLLLADAATVDSLTEPVADIVNLAANRIPWLARGLDVVLKVSPHAVTTGALTIGVAQLLVNHGVIPAGLVPGTQPVENVMEDFINRHMSDPDSMLGKAIRHLAGANAAAAPAAA
jgi:hypothetical protein